MKFWELFRIIVSVLPTDQDIYLVGGAIRDRLLGKEVHDLDFVVKGDCRKLAQRVSRGLKVPFFVMDAERLTSRVIYRAASGEQYSFDFISMIKDDLETDLRHRDFTINAIACEIKQPEAWIDPCGGLNDIEAKVLRLCSSTSLQDDPLRVLRGIRLALGLGLHFLPETEEMMRQAAADLGKVSPERKRDELFHLLEGDFPYEAVKKLVDLGVMAFLFPEGDTLQFGKRVIGNITDEWEQTSRLIFHLDRLLKYIISSKTSREDDHRFGRELAPLKIYADAINTHLKKVITPGRSIQSLLFFVCLSAQAGGDEAVENETIQARADALRLSNAEKTYLQKTAGYVRYRDLLHSNENTPGRREIYHFFKKLDEAGIDVCLIELANCLLAFESQKDEKALARCAENCRVLMQAWWENPAEMIHPTLLLDGEAIQSELNLTPGPLIGVLLECLAEAQATGEIDTREQAIAFLKKQKTGLNVHPVGD